MTPKTSLPRKLALSIRPALPSLRERFRSLVPILLGAALFAVAGGLGVAHVTVRLRKLDLGYALSRAATEQAVLAEERRRLRIEVAMLQSPERVLPAAEQKLRLAPPEPSQIEKEGR